MLDTVKAYLRNYDGPELRIMEICGSHTASIAKNGIRGLISPKIHLISGPGCPVCVTPASYVDRLIELSVRNTIVTFGDLIRVPGSKGSLEKARSEGGRVEMVYSPMDVLSLAEQKSNEDFIFAAVGFETTAPVYALLLDEIIGRNIKNIRLLTAVKTMTPVIEALLRDESSRIDAFIAPGHVAAVMGSDYFSPLAEKYGVPFGVSGFEGREVLAALAGIVHQVQENPSSVKNYYPSVVTEEGNIVAKKRIFEYFMPHDAVWRGIGIVSDSGLVLRDEYSAYDAGSMDLASDEIGFDEYNPACRCGEVLTGRTSSEDCPLFGKACTPAAPQGACMVSFEGSCYQKYLAGQ